MTSLALWPSQDGIGARESAADQAAGPPGEPGGVRASWQIATDPRKTPDEFRILFSRLFEIRDLSMSWVSGVALACVVPELQAPLRIALMDSFDRAPLELGPGVRTGMPIRTQDPKELGPDRIATAIGARARYGSPVIVLDFGTALTFDIVDEQGAYAGAIIAPGMEVAVNALSKRASQLNKIDLDLPERAIGTTTKANLQSGMVFGQLGLIQSLIDRALARFADARVVATGTLPDWLLHLLSQEGLISAYHPLLSLEGLRLIHHLNADRTTASR